MEGEDTSHVVCPAQLGLPLSTQFYKFPSFFLFPFPPFPPTHLPANLHPRTMTSSIVTAALTGCVAAILLNYIYTFLIWEYQTWGRLWAGVEPGRKGYQAGQMRFVQNCREVVAEGLRKVGEKNINTIPSFLPAATHKCNTYIGGTYRGGVSREKVDFIYIYVTDILLSDVYIYSMATVSSGSLRSSVPWPSFLRNTSTRSRTILI